MSWKRILKLARKVGAPVIVANNEGENAQVILPLDSYADLLNEGDSNWQRMCGLNHDSILESDDDVSGVPDIAVDEDGKINEAESYHQYRKKKDDDFGYTPYEELESIQKESDNTTRSKTAQPDAAAESAFEPMVNTAENVVAIKSIDEPWQVVESVEEINKSGAPGLKKSLSKSSEEISMEDRFYFEPLEDGGRNG